MPVKNAGVRLNEQIRVPQIRVIDDDGPVGVMTPQEAMKLAQERGVDLVEIAPTAVPPVCKLIDFGKWRYEQQKRDRQIKSTQHKQLIKELRFRHDTDTHDFEFKLRHARDWIDEGHKVKATVMFRGREIVYKEFGEQLLKRFQEAMADVAKLDGQLSLTGKLMTAMFAPLGKKKHVGDKKADGGGGEKPVKKIKSEFAEKLEKAAGLEPEQQESPDESLGS